MIGSGKSHIDKNLTWVCLRSFSLKSLKMTHVCSYKDLGGVDDVCFRGFLELDRCGEPFFCQETVAVDMPGEQEM